MSNVKLTKPQRDCLRDSTRDIGCSANDGYAPTLKLLELGLVSCQRGVWDTSRFYITRAGLAWLAAHPEGGE